MFNNIGTVEIIVIAIILMVLFGSKKIPEFVRGLTQATKEFRKGLQEEPEKKKKSDQ